MRRSAGIPIALGAGPLVLLVLLCIIIGCAGPAPSVEAIDEAKSAKKVFLLGPEDVLDITVWRSQDLTQKEVVVQPDGNISMPLIGEVLASGRTANQLAHQ